MNVLKPIGYRSVIYHGDHIDLLHHKPLEDRQVSLEYEIDNIAHVLRCDKAWVRAMKILGTTYNIQDLLSI